MKRYILKLLLAVFTALSLFILYLLSCFPLLTTTVLNWGEDKGSQEGGLQISGSTSSSNRSSIGNSGNTIIDDNTGNDSNNNTGIIDTSNVNNSAKSNDGKNDIITFIFKNPVNPEISDYIIVGITAKNAGHTKYPYGSIAINLSGEKIDILDSALPGNETDDIKYDKVSSENSTAGGNTGINITNSPGIYKIQERTRIFVDGIRHTYYIPVGENKYWRHDWNLDGPTLKGQISSFEIEIPKIEGIDIKINSVSLNKRIIFAADSHINYFLKSYFQLSYIDRYLTPAYIFLILFTAVFFVFCFSLNKRKNTGIRKAGGIGFKISFKTLGVLVPLLLLVLFSFYFISNYIFTVKGYWDSYEQYIISGRLDETYYGFSDFKKFVTWVDGKIPEGKNIIVLVRGEPVYIMAQMAYGLYPRDIKFIDIGRMSADETADKIMSLNFAESPNEDSINSANYEADKNNVEINNAGLTNDGDLTDNADITNNDGLTDNAVNAVLNKLDGVQTYEYIIVLSETDKEFLKSVKVKFEYNYRVNAGFLYKLILK